MTSTGQCLCGAISYEISADPIMTAICHCKDCQRSSGAAFSTNVVVPKPALSVSGEPKTFVTTGDESGQPRQRQFCPECGSQLFTMIEDMPDIAVVKAGTLDNTSAVQPGIEIWCKSGQGWREAVAGDWPKKEAGLAS